MSEPPRVRVHLPGDAPGRLLRWRQDQTGRWWAELVVHAPAEVVQQVDGEDYSQVPREPATPPQSAHGGYLLVAPKVAPGQPVKAELHRVGCWSIPQVSTSTLRVTPIEDADQARGLLRFPDTTPCTACTPDP